MKYPTRFGIAATTILTLGLAACGSSDAEDAEATTSVATTAPATSSTTSATSSPSSTSEEVPEPSDEAPVDAAEPASVEQRGIWAPPGQGYRCPGTDAYVWDFADCNPSNGVIDPDEFYRLMEGGSPDSAGVGAVPADPPRADGCVGPAAVCGYYDDSGQPIWFDKETGETSPRYYDEDGNPTMDPQ